MTKTVLVTGGTGWIGGWIIIELLKRGYSVRTTVRSLDKEPVVRTRIATEVDAGDRLSFVVADLTSDAGWDAAVAGCDYVLHVAAPVGIRAPRDPNELIIPTRDGALRVLKAACRAKVQRVVLTSALEACWPPPTSPDSVTDESHWTDTNQANVAPYRIAKTLAERAAWDFMATQSGPTTLTTILPSAVLGPVFTPEKDGSVQLISRLLEAKMPGIPRTGFCVVDVRDVADIHIRAMTAPEAAGQRFIAAGDWMWWADVAGVLRSSRNAGTRQILTRRLPDFVLKLGALFDPQMRFLVPSLGRKHDFTSAKAQKVLGWKPRPAATTIVDCAESLIAIGAV